MPNLLQLRLEAREIFDEALRALDPSAAIQHSVRLEKDCIKICKTPLDLVSNSRVFSIAIGKAALSMALALEDQLGELLVSGLIAGPIAAQPGGRDIAVPPRKLSTHWRWCEGGHPLPNTASLTAATEAFALLDRANDARGLVIFLLSGGGSAIMEQPIDEEVTLGDLRVANRVLVQCGASISEINAVRRTFSAVKGGKLAARAPNCDQITLIISDVPNGEEWNVASGPTLAPPANAPKAREVVERYQLESQIPAPILRAIDTEHRESLSERSTQLRKHFVLLDNNTGLDSAASAARKRGFAAEIARDISDQPIEVGVESLLTRLSELKGRLPQELDADVCLVSGGEFSCPVRGEGIGGRNLETALRLAIAAEQKRDQIGEFVALCAGTDGIDGNSPAAGAIVDSTTIERARRIGVDPGDFLNRSDSNSFFVALGDAITTGPTGTNVRDLRILLA